jgi:hypothetical protein
MLLLFSPSMRTLIEGNKFCNTPVTSCLISLLLIIIMGLILDEVITILYPPPVMYHFTTRYCDNGIITQKQYQQLGGSAG